MHCKEYLFVVSLFSGDDGRISDEREMNSWVWHQICLELIQIHVESSVEAKACRDGGDDLRYQTVEVCVRGTLDTKIPEVKIR